MKLFVSFAPTSTLRINELAVVSFLGHLLERRISQDEFLSEFGITVDKRAHLTIGFSPIGTMRINEESILLLLKRLLEGEIQRDPFLAQCGIRIEVGKTDQMIMFPSPPTNPGEPTCVSPPD